MAKIMASSCKYKPFAKQRCNRFAGFQPKQPQHQQHIIFVIMLLAVLILPYNFSLAEEATTLTTAFNTSPFEECTTANVVDITTIQTNNDNIFIISKQEQQPEANATNAINNETHIEGQVKIETEEHAISKENSVNEITLVLNGDFADTRTFNGNEPNEDKDQAVNAMPPPLVEENYSENINQTSENANDVDNDIFSILEERPGNKKSSDFNNSHMDTYVGFTENLEESIRNSVKNEIEMEQHLEPSPVLEILKDIPEPEIREILKEDLRIDPKILDENTFKWRREKNRSFETESDHNRIKPQPAMKNILTQELSSQMEKESLKALENAREIRNPNLGQDHEREQREQRVQVNTMQNTAEFNLLEEVRKNLNDYESNTEQSKNNDIKPYKGENDEEVEGSGLRGKKSNLEENDSLSVVLEESLTSSLPEPDEQQNLLNLEREEAASVQQELEEATTLTTEQTEHIVIKKVLDMRDILEMQPEIAETTLPLEEKEDNGNYANPVEPNDLEFVTGKIKAQESVEEKSQEEVKKNVNEVEWGSGVGEDSYNKFAPWPEEADSFNKKNQKNIKDFEDLSDSSQNNLESNSDDQSHVLSTEKIEIHKSNETDNQILIWPTNEALNSDEKLASEEVINGRTEEVTAIPPEYEENEKEQETLTESQIYLKSEEPESLSQDESSQLEQDNEKANSLQDEHLRVQDEFNIKQEGDEKDSFWLPTTEYLSPHSTENVLINAHMAVTPLGINLFTHDIRSTTENSLDIEYSSRTAKGSRSINTAINQRTATLFETYPPHDAGQTFNNNLAAETSSGIGKALPVSINDGTSRSTVIIILSSGTAFLFIIVSVTIFLISFQRQHGTLDIEMQERNCGKDNLDEEDAETFTKLLEIELPSQVAVALEETEECL
uniref:Uncharacterized protein n=1 Tax=Glossina morsitans morsitans TaxID=37546 RepID=A0A1B0G8S9_GLOMM